MYFPEKQRVHNFWFGLIWSLGQPSASTYIVAITTFRNSSPTRRGLAEGTHGSVWNKTTASLVRDTAVSVNVFLGKACCHRGYGFLKYRMSGLARSLRRLIFYVLSHQLSSFVVAYLFYCFLPPHSTIFHCQSLISISFPAFPASSFCLALFQFRGFSSSSPIWGMPKEAFGSVLFTTLLLCGFQE